jgi:hypothetical protein
MSDLLGIAVGHLYHYAATRKLLRPPGFLKQARWLLGWLLGWLIARLCVCVLGGGRGWLVGWLCVCLWFGGGVID